MKKGKRVKGNLKLNFWDRVFFAILTVFEGQVNEWVSKVMEKVAEVRGSGSGDEGEVEKVIEAELNSITEKIRASKCTHVLLIKGVPLLEQIQEYEIISIEEFLDRVQNLLHESISKGRVQGEELVKSKELESISETKRKELQVPPLEEFISRPLPIIGADDLYDWMTEEAKDIVSMVYPDVETGIIDDLMWDGNFKKLESKLIDSDAEYITIIEGSILYGYLDNKCEVRKVEDFLRWVYGYIFDDILERLADKRW